MGRPGRAPGVGWRAVRRSSRGALAAQAIHGGLYRLGLEALPAQPLGHLRGGELAPCKHRQPRGVGVGRQLLRVVCAAEMVPAQTPS